PLQRLGPPVRSIQAVQPFTAIRQADGSLAGRVLHIDRFGNVVTSIRRRDLAEGGHIRLSILGREVPGLVSSYGAAPSGLCCLIGSDSYLEVALAGGNAAAELGAGIGDAVELRMVS
ncbi:MAG TPA: SAM hydroxide adenosyltransferase, partial [Dehalococcoidia bacterium]|nr:SAM hydroxide adenosyltransferase [Dehalococcoidia bacterium]